MSYAPFASIPLLNHATETNSSICLNRDTSSIRERKETSHTAGRQKAATSPRIDYPLIVHCHLCWDWVWQRPQQFLSRLSHRHRVLFVETLAPDPNLVTPLAQIRCFDKWPNLALLRLVFPSWHWSDG